jgi:hypothetical protein
MGKRLGNASWRWVPLLLGAGLGLLCAGVDMLPYREGLGYRTLMWLGNSAAAWVTLAFGVGALSTSWGRALTAGPAALAAAVVTYYGSIAALGTRAGVPSANLLGIAALWLGAGLATGLCFGAAGQAWRAGPSAWPGAAAGVLGGALAGEALFHLTRLAPNLENPAFVVMCGQLALGLLLLVRLLRPWPQAAPAALAGGLLMTVIAFGATGAYAGLSIIGG